MRVAITGHRPEKLGEDHNELRMHIAKALKSMGATYMYQGMAPGADLISAKAARNIGVPFCSVVPWQGHVDTIPGEWLYDYEKAIESYEGIKKLPEAFWQRDLGGALAQHDDPIGAAVLARQFRDQLRRRPRRSHSP